jgi:hypothetical protein
MATEKNRRAFLSYSRVNKEFAIKLARGLRGAGYPIWFDQFDIPTGSRWDDEVEGALRDCSIFMIILTPAAIASENVKDEIGYAIDHGKRILPVLLEDCDVPLRLRRFQYVDFTTKSFEEGFESAKDLLGDLIDEVSVPLGATPPTVKAPVEVKPDPVQAKPVTPVEKKPAPVQPKPDSSASGTPSNKKGILIGIAIGIVSVIALCIVIVTWSNSVAKKMASQATSTSAVVASAPSKTPVPTKEPPTQKPASPYVLSSEDAKILWDNGQVKDIYNLAAESYTQDQLSTFMKNNEFIDLTLSNPMPLSIGLLECAGDLASLDRNLSFLTYAFELDSATIPEDKRLYVDYTDPEGRACRSTVAVIDNWTSGVYFVGSKWTVNSAYNDGAIDWTAGQTGGTNYMITVP